MKPAAGYRGRLAYSSLEAVQTTGTVAQALLMLFSGTLTGELLRPQPEARKQEQMPLKRINGQTKQPRARRKLILTYLYIALGHFQQPWG